jgi:hypothetical protein
VCSRLSLFERVSLGCLYAQLRAVRVDQSELFEELLQAFQALLRSFSHLYLQGDATSRKSLQTEMSRFLFSADLEGGFPRSSLVASSLLGARLLWTLRWGRLDVVLDCVESLYNSTGALLLLSGEEAAPSSAYTASCSAALASPSVLSSFSSSSSSVSPNSSPSSGATPVRAHSSLELHQCVARLMCSGAPSSFTSQPHMVCELPPTVGPATQSDVVALVSDSSHLYALLASNWLVQYRSTTVGELVDVTRVQIAGRHDAF